MIALTDTQLETLLTIAGQVPRDLRNAYLVAVAELLHGRDFSDGDVHKAALAARAAVVASV